MLVTAAVLLTGCASSGTPSPGPSASDATPSTSAAADILAPYDLDGLSVQEVVDTLDRTPVEDRAGQLLASVRPGELLLGEGDEETSLEIPDDVFYLSVAPYVDSTHDCYFHSLTTCTGEMSGEDVTVTIVDDEGTVLVDDEVTTFDNGFVGFWLPRDIEGTISVTADGLSAEQEFSTGADSATCLTTLQLA